MFFASIMKERLTTMTEIINAGQAKPFGDPDGTSGQRSWDVLKRWVQDADVAEFPAFTFMAAFQIFSPAQRLSIAFGVDATLFGQELWRWRPIAERHSGPTQ
jgi:hypothetical protein